MFIWCKLRVDTRFDLAWIGFHFITHYNADQRTKCNQMRFASIQYSKMRLRSGLRPGSRRGAYSAPQTPWRGRCGVSRVDRPWPTQNFGWVVHDAFRPTNNLPAYSLILFANSLKTGAARYQIKAKMHQIRFPLGLCPRPRWSSLQRSPRP